MQTLRKQGRFTRVIAWMATILLALSYILSATLVNRTSLYAAELPNRFIAMGTSEADAETTYTVEFDLATAGEVGAIVVEFCNSDPLPNETCTNTAVGDDVPEIDGTGAGSAVTLNQGSSTFGSTNGECNAANSDLVLDTISDGDRSLLVTCTATETFAGGETVTLVFNNVDNPSNTTSGNNNDTFYARIYTYSTITPPDPNTNNPVLATNQVDTGGIAMSTAEQLTITARVQEILEFCVGTSLVAQPVNDCGDMTGNAVDMGVLDFATATYSIADEGEQGSIMVRTNAAIGVNVDYFAEQAGTGTNQLGALRVSGATCAADGPPSTDETDQCINSAGATQVAITPGEERFGFCIDDVDDTSSVGTTTNNLTPDAEYDGVTNGCAVDGVAFLQTGATDRIATSVGQGGVVNDEMLILDFGGTSDLTTPSGLYTVTLTFIGTATF